MGIEVDANQGGERGIWAAFEACMLSVHDFCQDCSPLVPDTLFCDLCA